MIFWCAWKCVCLSIVWCVRPHVFFFCVFVHDFGGGRGCKNHGVRPADKVGYGTQEGVRAACAFTCVCVCHCFFLCVGVCLPVMIIVSGVLDFGEDLDQKEHAILSGQRTRWGVGGGGKELVLSLFFCVLFVCPWELIAFASSFTPAPPHPSPPPPVHTARHTNVPPFCNFFSAHLHPPPP